MRFTNLVTEMARKNITQKQIAKALGIEPTTLAKKINFKTDFTLPEIPQPLCLNTPHVLIESENGYELPDYAKEQVEELKRQAILYANGESAEKQQTLPLDGTDN